MDYLQDPPVSTKQHRTLFFVFLILLAGVLAALFYFNFNPLSPKYISVVNFDSAKINRIPNSVILLGRGLPQAQVTLTLTPGQTNAKLKTDKEGNWTFKLPQDLPAGKYILTLFIDDKSGNLASIKNYQLEIVDSRPFFLKFSFPKVHAQAQQQLDFAEWAKYMRGFGIYPAEENGEIILYSEEQFNKKYCQTGCYFEPKSPSLIISQINIQEILLQLQLTLISQGYHRNCSLAIAM